MASQKGVIEVYCTVGFCRQLITAPPPPASVPAWLHRSSVPPPANMHNNTGEMNLRRDRIIRSEAWIAMSISPAPRTAARNLSLKREGEPQEEYLVL